MKKFFILCFLLCTTNLFTQVEEVRNYIFGHSLIDHRPPLSPTPSDETTVPHWLYLLAKESGKDYSAGGQYGFLPQHQQLPPSAQWGYDLVPGVWDSDYESWEEAAINTILITAGNFIQYQPPSEPYFNDPETTPISATVRIIDFVGDKSVFIYENWPDMAGFVEGEGFPPTASEFDNYNEYVRGDFHNWWLDYHDALRLARPEANVKMIPIGPIISELLLEILEDFNAEELYEDNAPHGLPNIYYLASLITYTAIFKEQAPLLSSRVELIDQRILDRHQQIADFIWQKLIAFVDEDGKSRVFETLVSSTKFSKKTNVSIFPNPSSNRLSLINVHTGTAYKIINQLGVIIASGNTLDDFVDISYLQVGFYFLELKTNEGRKVLSFFKSE